MATTDPNPVPVNDPKIAMILVDHGSRRDEANRVVEEIAAQIRQDEQYSFVAVAHMELVEPTLGEAFKRCAEWGAESGPVAFGAHELDVEKTVAVPGIQE